MDLLEEREKLVPLDLLDLLDLLDSPLVPFTLRTVGHNCRLIIYNGCHLSFIRVPLVLLELLVLVETLVLL